MPTSPERDGTGYWRRENRQARREVDHGESGERVAVDGQWYWLSTKRMTVTVGVDPDGIIFAAAPIVRKFIGQPLTNLERWLDKQEDFDEVKL